MVSKRDRVTGLLNGVRCRICNRKLKNPKSVARQIGPVCWSKLGRGDNWKQPLSKSQTRCRECGTPMQDLKQVLLWRQRWDELCTQYCCGCCPARNDLPCVGDLKTKAWEEKQQKRLEAFV